MIASFAIALAMVGMRAQAADDDAYRIVPIPVPKEIVLEVGGLDVLPDGRIAVCTRRGDVYFIDGAFADPPAPKFHLFASGLHEPLGLVARDGAIEVVQRGELTRLRDTDGDGRADRFETVCDAWSISGNYHEYAFGPKLDRNGDRWLTLNLGWTDSGVSLVPWRGWAVKVKPDGRMEPIAAGLRSPSGLGLSPDDDAFYTDNQGDWNPTCSLRHIARGDFVGHPASLRWCSLPESPMASPGDPPSGLKLAEAKRAFPALKLTAVWFPYKRMGQAASDLLWDTTGGKFGPFQRQLFVGDQTTSEVMRVVLEKVGGEWQGACIPFRAGLPCGVLRMGWGPDGSMVVGMTNRGWGSVGEASEGLARLVWTGRTPFEVAEIHARKVGFEVRFTEPVDAASAARADSYDVSSFTYLHHRTYGSDEVDKKKLRVVHATVAADARSVLLEIDGLREVCVHELRLPGVRSRDGKPLAHPLAFYTLNQIPN